IQEARAEEEARAFGNRVSSIHRESGAVILSGIKIGNNAVAMFWGDQRPHFVAFLQTGADLDGLHSALDRFYQLVRYSSYGYYYGNSHTTLARRAKGGRDSGICSHANVCIGQYNHVVLGP